MGGVADALRSREREQTLGWIRELAAVERPSASAGERRAAEWIVTQLLAAAVDPRVETVVAARRLGAELVRQLDGGGGSGS